MGYGLRCTECGYQETEHERPYTADGACPKYKSPDAAAEASMRKDERERKISSDSYRRRGGPAYEH